MQGGVLAMMLIVAVIALLMGTGLVLLVRLWWLVGHLEQYLVFEQIKTTTKTRYVVQLELRRPTPPP